MIRRGDALPKTSKVSNGIQYDAVQKATMSYTQRSTHTSSLFAAFRLML